MPRLPLDQRVNVSKYSVDDPPVEPSARRAQERLQRASENLQKRLEEHQAKGQIVVKKVGFAGPGPQPEGKNIFAAKGETSKERTSPQPRSYSKVNIFKEKKEHAPELRAHVNLDVGASEQHSDFDTQCQLQPATFYALCNKIVAQKFADEPSLQLLSLPSTYRKFCRFATQACVPDHQLEQRAIQFIVQRFKYQIKAHRRLDGNGSNPEKPITLRHADIKFIEGFNYHSQAEQPSSQFLAKQARLQQQHRRLDHRHSPHSFDNPHADSGSTNNFLHEGSSPEVHAGKQRSVYSGKKVQRPQLQAGVKYATSQGDRSADNDTPRFKRSQKQLGHHGQHYYRHSQLQKFGSEERGVALRGTPSVQATPSHSTSDPYNRAARLVHNRP